MKIRKLHAIGNLWNGGFFTTRKVSLTESEAYASTEPAAIYFVWLLKVSDPVLCLVQRASHHLFVWLLEGQLRAGRVRRGASHHLFVWLLKGVKR